MQSLDLKKCGLKQIRYRSSFRYFELNYMTLLGTYIWITMFS
uniref:Uncharacterized protein n=1 Tax=Meloidogyne enterolobii TaxID=390850 RepID=A0A6V7UNE7_MELEN|nr:unnamed protein product [Meloidogyne enterolobii]